MRDVVVSLDYTPRRWQAECEARLKRFNVLVIHRRAGKTIFVILQLVLAALACGKPNARFAYIAPELGQAKRAAWGYLKEYASKVPGTRISEGELFVEFGNGARISIYGADYPDRLRGIYLDGAVLDELAQMRPETWGTVVLPALLDRHGWCIFIGTQKGITMLTEMYNQHVNDPDDSDWFCASYTVYETDALTDDELETAKREMTENEFRQEMLNDPSATNEGQIVPTDLVLRAVGKSLREEAYKGAAKLLGVDVAFAHEGDRSVIFPRQGLAAFRPWIGRGVGNQELADKIARFADSWEPDALLIDQGRGEGVISKLERLGFGGILTPCIYGAKAAHPRFGNKRVEMIADGVVGWLEAGGALPEKVPGLMEDFCGPCYRPDSQTGKMYMETGAQMKARGLKSPDLLMSFGQTFYAPVYRRPEPDDPSFLYVAKRPEVVVDDDEYYSAWRAE